MCLINCHFIPQGGPWLPLVSFLDPLMDLVYERIHWHKLFEWICVTLRDTQHVGKQIFPLTNIPDKLVITCWYPVQEDWARMLLRQDRLWPCSRSSPLWYNPCKRQTSGTYVVILLVDHMDVKLINFYNISGFEDSFKSNLKLYINHLPELWSCGLFSKITLQSSRSKEETKESLVISIWFSS